MHTGPPCTQNTHAQSVNLKNVVRKRCLEVKFARLTQRVQSSIRAIWGAMVAQWWEHKWPWFKAICGFSLFSFFPLLQEVFLRTVFLSTKRKQHLKTPIRPRMLEEESLSGSATSKSLFIFYSFSFISIFLILLGIAISHITRYRVILLQVRNRKLKKELTREKRNAREQQEHLQQQVPSRAAFSIIAASSAEELATILQNERKGQVKIMLPLENDKETGAS